MSTYPGAHYPTTGIPISPAHSAFLGVGGPVVAQGQPGVSYHPTSPAPSASTYPGDPTRGGGVIPGGYQHATGGVAQQYPSPYQAAPSPYIGSAPSSGSTLVGSHSPAVGQYAFPTGAMNTTHSGGQLTVGHAAVAAASAQQAQPFSSNVQAGAVTYTMTTDASGRALYHHFKAEPATYRSPQGVTYSGIQWVPTETSTSPPIGIPPASQEILASFRGQIPTVPPGAGATYSDPGRTYSDPGRGYPDSFRAYPDTNRAYQDASQRGDGAYRDWDKEEMRRIKKEEKEAAKRATAWEAERRARERAEDKELRKARERDLLREQEAERNLSSRVRRLSNVGGAGPVPSVYEREHEREREREDERELERRMGELNVGGGHLSTDYNTALLGRSGTRSRRQSLSIPGGVGAYDEYDKYGERERDRLNDLGRGVIPPSAERSPYRGDRGSLAPGIGPGGVPVYPRGHIYAGQPIPGGITGTGSATGPPSRAVSPGPGAMPYPSAGGGLSAGMGTGVLGGGGVSPRFGGGVPLAGSTGYSTAQEQQLLKSPEAFTRPINLTQSFTAFEMTKIQDLDDFLEPTPRLPRLPSVLMTHDVSNEDWLRLMEDLEMAWGDRLPLPTYRPKRSTLVTDLLDLWNARFFIPRGVELVLYKGRERRSGRGAGRPELRLPRTDSSDSYSDSESEDSFSDQDAAERYRQYGMYGRGFNGQERYAAEMREARHARRERREEKKRRARERKQRRKERARKYSLYMTYIPPNQYGRDYAGSAQSVHSGHGY